MATANITFRRQDAVVAAIAEEIANARRILDLGCGNGRYLQAFRKAAPDALALGADLTPEMIAEARARQWCRYSAHPCDATAAHSAMPSSTSFFISHVLQFVSDKDATMSDLARCLSPGGAVIITVGGGGHSRVAARYRHR